METIFRNTGNSKTNEPHNFILNLPRRLDLRSLNKLYIYYMWKKVRQQYKNNKLKIMAPMWNDEFELPDSFYSVPDVQDYIE